MIYGLWKRKPSNRGWLIISSYKTASNGRASYCVIFNISYTTASNGRACLLCVIFNVSETDGVYGRSR